MGAGKGGPPDLDEWLELSGRFQDLLKGALRRAEGHPRRLLEIARFAGHLAWTAHPGSFVLPEAERALRDASGLDGTSPGFVDPRPVSGRTLHVLSEVYEVGGHTRLVRRFLQAAEEDAAVVLVRQGEAFSRSWVAPEGKAIPVLDLEAMGVTDSLDKVAALRLLFEAAARVVLHIHPDDAVSVAAAARAPAADIRFFNHADHVAWLGAALPALLLNARSSGARLAAARRGVPESRHALVPVPLEPPRRLSRHHARARLGLGESERMLLTVAAEYKYNAVRGRSLLEALAAVLTRPDIKLVAIGPTPAHPVFGRLAERFPGRVEALGVIPDPDHFRAAADIYVDSYPFCSPTSLFESALMGTPVVAYQPDFEILEVLYNDCPGVDRADFAAGDPARFSSLVSDLLDVASRRESMLHGFRRGIEPSLPEKWRARWADMLPRRARSGEWAVPDRARAKDPLDVVLAGLGRDPSEFLRRSRWEATDLLTRLLVLATRVRRLV